ncbi:MAG: 4Fe-4S binding protein [Proteobacteria bacterium]|nr:4Fe-4S binding protein [Pseudomonadota bacterium]
MKRRGHFLVGAILALFLAFPLAPLFAANIDIESHVSRFFPEWKTVGEFKGDPVVAIVTGKQGRIGYLFKTDDIFAIPAYSGKPISTLVGIDMQGTIKGIQVIKHEEPILAVGVSEEDLANYVKQYEGLKLGETAKVGGSDRPGYVAIDGISGATITVIVINSTVMRSLQAVVKAKGVGVSKSGKVSKKVSTHKPLLSRGAAVERGIKKSVPLGQQFEIELNAPIWIGIWNDRAPQIFVLLLCLFALGMVLIFQDWLAMHVTLLTRMRNTFLVLTVVVIGWVMLAQLSVVNVLTFASAIMHNFSWDIFLMEPAIFLLWGFVAVTLLLWGRGVYCGWLCPFGALQELINKVARHLKIRQLEFPAIVHERLLALKYIIFILLFGLSLQSMGLVLPFIEVEPFKTVFVMHFDREWPFLLYALLLLVITVFNRKFYCKYLCPLGAAMAIPSQLRLFDWLRRRKECGRPCQTCATECEVQAIRPTGEINTNECHYCLDCQVTYWNAYKCPPMVEKRKRLEKREKARAKIHSSADEAES